MGMLFNLNGLLLLETSYKEISYMLSRWFSGAEDRKGRKKRKKFDKTEL